MTALIVTIHVIVSIALILIVLLQSGKGADMGAVFGGAGSQALFGNTGAATFLGKLTTVAAVVFMITSLSLAYLSKSGGKSVVSDIKPATQQTQPVETQPPAQPSAMPAATQSENNAAAPEQPSPSKAMPTESAAPVPVVPEDSGTPSSK